MHQEKFKAHQAKLGHDHSPCHPSSFSMRIRWSANMKFLVTVLPMEAGLLESVNSLLVRMGAAHIEQEQEQARR